MSLSPAAKSRPPGTHALGEPVPFIERHARHAAAHKGAQVAPAAVDACDELVGALQLWIRRLAPRALARAPVVRARDEPGLVCVLPEDVEPELDDARLAPVFGASMSSSGCILTGNGRISLLTVSARRSVVSGRCQQIERGVYFSGVVETALRALVCSERYRALAVECCALFGPSRHAVQHKGTAAASIRALHLVVLSSELLLQLCVSGLRRSRSISGVMAPSVAV